MCFGSVMVPPGDGEQKFPYKIGQLLGRGRFGTVKAATHCDTHHKVAIKMVKKQHFEPDEVHIQCSLDHKHIMKVHEAFDLGEYVCIVMDYMPGRDLIRYLGMQVRLRENDAQRLFQQLIDAIGHCHDNSIVHRDVKAENILLDDDNNMKLIDFGFAGRLQDDQLPAKNCGSMHYAAPEVLSKDCQFHGPEVDVWSCGVVLYLLLTSYLPFDSCNSDELREMIGAGLYSIPGEVSSSVKNLIMEMLTVNQGRRISVAMIREHSWCLHRERACTS